MYSLLSHLTLWHPQRAVVRKPILEFVMKRILILLFFVLPVTMAFVSINSNSMTIDGMTPDNHLLSMLTEAQKKKLLRLRAHKIFIKYKDTKGEFANTTSPDMSSSRSVGFRCGEAKSACFTSHVLLDVRGRKIGNDTGLGFHTENGEVYAYSSGDVRDKPKEFTRTIESLISELEIFRRRI